MEDREYLVLLYDYYGELLGDLQREYFEEYYFDNLSLSEISIALNISRNAVHKQLKVTSDKLLFYESKLNLKARDDEILKILEEVKDKKVKEKIEKLLV